MKHKSLPEDTSFLKCSNSEAFIRPIVIGLGSLRPSRAPRLIRYAQVILGPDSTPPFVIHSGYQLLDVTT